MVIDWAAFVVVAATALLFSAALESSSQLRLLRSLLVAGAAMRIVGVFGRHWMIFDLYHGGSDAVGYFEAGTIIADHFRSLDFSIIGSGQWGEREWGTQVIRYAAGIVMTFVGPSLRTTFLVFSLIAFAGLVCMAVAYGRGGSQGSTRHAALLLFFWPSLWFWPSSVGKEAVLLLAIGLVTLGYVGNGRRIRWAPMTAGLILALIIRPHVAGVLAVAACASEWTSGGWTSRRFVQSMVTSALTITLLVKAFTLLGVNSTDYTSVESFVTHWAQQTSQGGSAIERADSSLVAVPMAFINILFRPFLTEARSAVAIVSSLEMLAFWALVLLNVQRLSSVFRSWQTNRLLRFVIPFALLYILMIGLTFQNLGIIARQRTLVLPALLMVLATTMTPAGVTVVPRVRRSWKPMPSTAVQASK
jgi:hypothetical protein